MQATLVYLAEGSIAHLLLLGLQSVIGAWSWYFAQRLVFFEIVETRRCGVKGWLADLLFLENRVARVVALASSALA